MRKCRVCESWFTTPDMQVWKGNCSKHPFKKDKYSETATPNEDCKGRDFVDKYAKYQAAQEVKSG